MLSTSSQIVLVEWSFNIAGNEQVLLQFRHLKLVTPELLLMTELLLMYCSIAKFITSN